MLISCNLRGACHFENVDELRVTAGYLWNGFSSENGLAFPHMVFFAGRNLVKFLSGFLQGSALGGYHRHEFVPGFYE